MEQNWHSLTYKEVIKNLNSDMKHGLTADRIEVLSRKYGLNKLPEAEKTNMYTILLRQFFSPLILILLVAGIVTFVLHEYVDSVVIFIVVIVNSIIGFTQELKAERAIESLKEHEILRSYVIRDGVQKIVDADDLVPGDIVLIKAGDKVPADLRLIETINLRIDESILTGESISSRKQTKKLEDKIAIGDRTNIAYSRTIVTQGKGYGIVVETGANSQIGQISELVHKSKIPPTPLQKKLKHLALILGVISIVIMIPIIILGVIENMDMLQIFELAVSLAVSAVPEGLPAIITISLAFGVKRMLKVNALIRRLPVVEVLGSTDVICTDKTGTLTTNEMVVTEVYLMNSFYRFYGNGYETNGEIYSMDIDNAWDKTAFQMKSENFVQKNIKKDINLENFLIAGTLCNDATVNIGDPTEKAIVVAAAKKGINVETLRETHTRVNEIPFSSENMYMVTVNKGVGKILKGASEKVLNLCNDVIDENGERKILSTKDKEEILDLNSSMAERGLRVLAIAMSNDVSDLNEKDYSFLGLVGMFDPPRKEVKEAIEASYNAGIRVVMITGDHALTAKSIAEQVGIDSNSVITGLEIDDMNENTLRKKVEECSIFARVTSEHKLKILSALQMNNHVVGMGGDGVNDAPAVKRADIGFSVGDGTELTKEVSDMILMDNNFATLPKAIKEGRVIYQNIRNFLKLLLSANFDEIFAILFSLILQIPVIFIPIHILWINLLTDGPPAIAMSLDKPQDDIMQMKPRDRDKSILSGIFPFIIFAGVLGCLVGFVIFSINYPWWDRQFNDPILLSLARTAVFVETVMFELVVVFIVRTKHFAFSKSAFQNKSLLFAVGLSFILLLGALYLPGINTLLKAYPLPMMQWVQIIISTILVTGMLEIFKIYYYRNKEF